MLPAGALDDEPPHAQRVTEATGNEGASFDLLEALRVLHAARCVQRPPRQSPRIQRRLPLTRWRCRR